MSGEVEITLENDGRAIRAVNTPRAGWAVAFQKMSDCGDDALPDDQTVMRWDEVEWQW